MLQGVGLCHGINGNGYAFLTLYRTTGEVKYLVRAQQFALFAAQNWEQLYDKPDRPASLYEVRKQTCMERSSGRMFIMPP